MLFRSKKETLCQVKQAWDELCGKLKTAKSMSGAGKVLTIHPNDKMTPLERGKAIADGRDYDRLIMDPFLGEIKARIIGKNTKEYWTNEDNLVIGDILSTNRFGLDGMGVGPNAYGIAEAIGVVPHYPEQGLIYVEKHPIDSIDEVDKLKNITLESRRLKIS